MLFDERGVVIALLEDWVIEDTFKEADVIIESCDFIFF